MDKKSIERYLNQPEVKQVNNSYEDLKKRSKDQHDVFVENNIVMADRWLGASGDHFVFAANTVSAYLIHALRFFDANVDILYKYMLTFENVDKELTETGNFNEG